MSADIDRKRVETLAEQIMIIVHANYIRGPTSRARTLEALNALASVAALLIIGADGRSGRAHLFLLEAIDLQLDDLALKRDNTQNN